MPRPVCMGRGVGWHHIASSIHEVSPQDSNQPEVQAPRHNLAVDSTSAAAQTGDGTLAGLAVHRPAGAMDEDHAKTADPPALGFQLSPELHPSGDGSLFSVSHSLMSRELGSRGFR